MMPVRSFLPTSTLPTEVGTRAHTPAGLWTGCVSVWIRVVCLLAATWTVTPVCADVTLGLALPRSGPLASIGDQVLSGANAAARDINARGGVGGQRLVLQVEDDACDPRQAVSVANRLVQNRVRFVVGHVCSGASIVASDVYAEAGALMISPASNIAKLTERRLPAVFRICGRDDQQGELSGRVIAERFGGRRVAILHDNSPFGRGLADATRSNLHRRGFRETLFEALTPGERDYTAVISRLKAAAIELVYYGGYHQEMGTLLRQASEQSYKARWLGSSGIASQEFSAIAGPAADGVLMTFNPDPRLRPEAESVVAAFASSGVDPDGFTLYAYAAVQVLALALDRANSTDPAVVARLLKQASFDTILGTIRFDGKGDVSAPGYVLYVWRKGRYEYETSTPQ